MVVMATFLGVKSAGAFVVNIGEGQPDVSLRDIVRDAPSNLVNTLVGLFVINATDPGFVPAFEPATAVTVVPSGQPVMPGATIQPTFERSEPAPPSNPRPLADYGVPPANRSTDPGAWRVEQFRPGGDRGW